MTTRQQLYAMGLQLGDCVTRRKLGGGYLCGGGGGGSSSSNTATTTNNADNRQALQDAVGLTNSNGNSVSYNSTDAVKAIAGMGTDVIRQTGAAVVQLNETSTAANVTAWDATTRRGADMVDKSIGASSDIWQNTVLSSQKTIEQIAEKGFAISQAAINSYQPTDNKNSDTLMKLGMVAAAAVAASVIFGKK